MTRQAALLFFSLLILAFLSIWIIWETILNPFSVKSTHNTVKKQPEENKTPNLEKQPKEEGEETNPFVDLLLESTKNRHYNRLKTTTPDVKEVLVIGEEQEGEGEGEETEAEILKKIEEREKERQRLPKYLARGNEKQQQQQQQQPPQSQTQHNDPPSSSSSSTPPRLSLETTQHLHRNS